MGPRVGIALSGGVARCIAHFGVLEVLLEEGIPIHAVSGTSAGSLVGALYTSGRFPLPELQKISKEITWWKLTRPTASRKGLLSSDRLGKFLESHIGPMEFSETQIPLAVVTADLLLGEKVVLKEGKISRAVQASCSLPVIFNPTVIGDRALVDGGIVSQIPVLAAREDLGVERVIAVDVNYHGMDLTRTPRNSIQIAVHLASLSARKNAEEEGKLSDFMIRVNVKGIGLMDLKKGEDLLERGRSAAREAVTAIKQGIRVTS